MPPTLPLLAVFEPLDWAVLAGYFVLLAVTGWLLSRRRQADTRDYFLAGRRMPAWAAAISLMATTLSVATFVGLPELSYTGNLTYLSHFIGQILAAVIVAVFFIPVFYRHNAATVYELLGRRFGQSSKLTASWMFMVGRVFASGARLYIAALAGSTVLFGDIAPTHVCIAVAALTGVGVFYTLAGGIASVIWTDVIQAAVLIGAALIVLGVLLQRIPADLSQITAVLSDPGDGQPSKLTTLRLGFSEFGSGETFTLLTALFGFSLIALGAFGTDQDMTQRMLTCRSAAAGSWSAIGGILIAVPVALLFLVVGLGLYVFYQRPDLMGAAAPATPPGDSREVFLTFIVGQMPPGTSGLMMAGLFAAGLSSLNSALNAMSSTLINDFYRRRRPDRDEQHYLRMSRLAVVGWGLLLGAFATFSVFWQRHSDDTLIDFALKVMVFAYSGLVGVYLTALFTNRGNNASVLTALAAGFLAVLTMQLQPWAWWGGAALDLAFPWQMLIATTLAFTVCFLGTPSRTEGDRWTSDEPISDVTTTAAVGGRLHDGNQP